MAAGLFLFSACTAPAPAVRPPAQSTTSHPLRVAISQPVTSLSPRNALVSLPFVYLPMYDSLTRLGPGYSVLPGAAVKWEVAPSGTGWMFSLRDDLTWQNGSSVTAEDVAFSVNQMVEHAWPCRVLLPAVTGAKVVDQHTVEVLTRSQDVSVPSALAYLWLIPKTYYEAVGPAGFDRNPVGSGPYEVANFEPGANITFRRRATRHAYRFPVADTVKFQVIPGNIARLGALRSGEADITLNVTYTPEQVDLLQRSGVMMIANDTSSLMVMLPEGTADARQSPLRDRRVRLALNYAVNKSSIASIIYRGLAEPIGQAAVPGTFYWDDSAPAVPFDPKKAADLLVDAGYPAGFQLAGGLDLALGPAYRDAVLAVQSDLRDIGVNFNINLLDSPEYEDRLTGRGGTLRGDLWVQSVSDYTGFAGSLRGIFGCNRPIAGQPSSVFYCNPAWDKLMDQALAELDPARRVQLLHEANRIQREDIPAIFLVTNPTFIAYTARVQGLNVTMPYYYTLDRVSVTG